MTPCNTEAEEIVLATICSEGKDAILGWNPDHFFVPRNQVIFKAILEAAEANDPIDALAIATRIQNRGKSESLGGFGQVLALLSATTIGPSVLPFYLRELSELRARRAVLSTIREAQPSLENLSMPLSEFVSEVTKAAENGEIAKPVDLKDQLLGLIEELECQTIPTRYVFGLPSLDNRLQGGVEPGEMFVVAGDTSSGKTILMHMLALESIKRGHPTVIYSLEMRASAVLRRLAANLANRRIKTAADGLTNEDAQAIMRSVTGLSEMPLIIRDSLMRLDAILADATALVRQKGVKVVIVDYLQLVEHEAELREQAVSEISRRIKNLGNQHNVTIITGSQLNEKGKLRESRAIGQHADGLIFIAEEDTGTELFCGKFRRGERNWSVPVVLRGMVSRFEEP